MSEQVPRKWGSNKLIFISQLGVLGTSQGALPNGVCMAREEEVATLEQG